MKEKCVYMVPEIEYLSHKINREGLQPSDSKVTVILEECVRTQIISWYGKLLWEVSAQSFNNLDTPLPTTVERDPLAVER